MSSGDSELPPTYYFDGILFNPDFYTSASSDYLTASTGKKLFLSYPISQGSEIFPSNITLQSTLTDSSGDVGTAGQILSSTGTGTNWISSTSGATYIGYTASATLPTSPNPRLLVIFSGTTASQTLTIPALAYSLGQVIQIRNRSNQNVTISSGLSSMMIYATSVTATSYTLIPEDSFNLVWNGFAYMQYTPSNLFTTLTTSGLLTANGDITSPTITSTTKFKGIAYDAPTAASTLSIGETLTNGATAAVTPLLIGISINGTPTKGIQIGNSATKIGLDGATTALSIATASGSISSGGIITGTSVVAPSFNASSNTTDVGIATTQTSGDLNIGTGARTTAGVISIGTGSAVNNVINIGGANSRSTIGGYLYNSVTGYIAGIPAVLSMNSNTLPFTISTSVMSDYLIRFTGSASGTMTIPAGYPEGQRITVKNTGSGTITITFSGGIFPTGSTTSSASISIGAGGFVSAINLGTVWIQT
jgi:hypothetical protein